MLFGISRNGLLAMAASVFALWSVIALETATLHRAAEDARASRQMLDRLRQSIPASEPAPWSSPRTIHAS